MTGTAVEEIACKDWDQLIKRLDALGGEWIHRAQRRASWELNTTFERHRPKDRKPAASEKIWREEFERRAHFYVAPQLTPTDTVEWLALMQHFGAPTRLLDFTRSPYIASYFALEDEGEEPHCAVWSVNESWCRLAAASVLKNSPSKHAVLTALRKKHSADVISLTFAIQIAVERVADVFNSAIIKHNPTMVLPIRPQRLSERLSIQQGTFLCTGNIDKPFMENLAAMNGWEKNVKKFTLSFDQRGSALETMRKMNITRASLFPGLDGFAQSFRNFFECESPEQKSSRIAREALESMVDEMRK